MTEFKSGDIIRGSQRKSRYIVIEPIRTPMGKLRTLNKNGGLTTFWWPSREELPHNHRLERVDEGRR